MLLPLPVLRLSLMPQRRSLTRSCCLLSGFLLQSNTMSRTRSKLQHRDRLPLPQDPAPPLGLMPCLQQQTAPPHLHSRPQAKMLLPLPVLRLSLTPQRRSLTRSSWFLRGFLLQSSTMTRSRLQHQYWLAVGPVYSGSVAGEWFSS